MYNEFFVTVGQITVFFLVFLALVVIVWLIFKGSVLIIGKIEERNEIKNKAKAEKFIKNINLEKIDDITIKKLMKILNKFPLYIYSCNNCDNSSDYNGLCTKGIEQENECKKQNEFYLLKEKIKKYMNSEILISEINFESLKKMI